MGRSQWTDSVQEVVVFRFKDPLAGLQEVAFGIPGPAIGAFQAKGAGEAGSIGLLEREPGKGGGHVHGGGAGTPACRAPECGAAAREELLLQR